MRHTGVPAFVPQLPSAVPQTPAGQSGGLQSLGLQFGQVSSSSFDTSQFLTTPPTGQPQGLDTQQATTIVQSDSV